MADTESGALTLAKHEGLGSVTVCNCGVVSVHIGGVTVRLEMAAFAGLESMVHKAMNELSLQAITARSTQLTPINTFTH